MNLVLGISWPAMKADAVDAGFPLMRTHAILALRLSNWLAKKPAAQIAIFSTNSMA
jgi:hypothetical protein